MIRRVDELIREHSVGRMGNLPTLTEGKLRINYGERSWPGTKDLYREVYPEVVDALQRLTPQLYEEDTEQAGKLSRDAFPRKKRGEVTFFPLVPKSRGEKELASFLIDIMGAKQFVRAAHGLSKRKPGPDEVDLPMSVVLNEFDRGIRSLGIDLWVQWDGSLPNGSVLRTNPQDISCGCGWTWETGWKGKIQAERE